jgi:hypothetical protein
LVSLEGGTLNLQADADGRFRLEAPQGRQHLVAKALEFLPARLTLEDSKRTRPVSAARGNLRGHPRSGLHRAER